MSDQESRLVQRAQTGDVNAFRKLVDLHKEQVYYLAWDLTGNHHDAEDLSQDAFVKAYRSLKSYRGEGRFGAWLHRITVNQALNQKRKKALKAMQLEEDPGAKRSGSMSLDEGHLSGNPETSTANSLAQTHIQEALTQLTPRERAVFVLRHYQDLQLREIARQLDIAEGTVKGLLFRAVRKLQKALSFYRNDLGLESSP